MLKPADVDVIELHDCFSANELITYEALGLCPAGKAGEYRPPWAEKVEAVMSLSCKLCKNG